MKEFQQKRKIRRFLYSRVSVLILFILVVLTAKAMYGVYDKERESRKNVSRAQEELSSLQERRKALETKVTRLQTPEGREAEIREQFPVAKPGERMVVIVENQSSESAEPLPKKSLFTKFFDIFRSY